MPSDSGCFLHIPLMTAAASGYRTGSAYALRRCPFAFPRSGVPAFRHFGVSALFRFFVHPLFIFSPFLCGIFPSFLCGIFRPPSAAFPRSCAPLFFRSPPFPRCGSLAFRPPLLYNFIIGMIHRSLPPRRSGGIKGQAAESVNGHTEGLKMLNEKQKKITSDRQIKKFCAYGFLKNLKFFEPYLLIFLMGKGISLFEIGILIAIRETVVNVFEIPSGFIADYFGRKKELYFSFGFYIVSFICFFFTDSFPTAIAAMLFFGLGEAFRSGTHKAMIYTYLDSMGWQEDKTFVYGRTRSFSLIGSACSSVIGILLILTVPSVNLIFLFSVIPYLLDFFLILSYPRFLDNADKKERPKFRVVFRNFLNGIKKNRSLRRILLEEGIFESTISYIKDLIQPILEAIIVGSGAVILSSLTAEDNLKVILGIVYAVLNLLGSFSSKKAYAVKGKKSSLKCLYIIHGLLAVCMAVLAFVSKISLAVFLVYIFIYALFNVRKPIFVDEVDEHIKKNERATILSISSQLKSLFLMIFAPLLGFAADRLGIGAVMGILAVVFLCTLPLLNTPEKSDG